MSIQYQLRYYQVEVINQIQQLMNLGYSKFSLFFPKRLGKTIMKFGIANELFQSNRIQSAIIICKNKEIKYQSEKICAEWSNFSKTAFIKIMTQHEVKKQYETILDDKDLIILDDVTASMRNYISSLKCISKKIVISISNGPYKYIEKQKSGIKQKTVVSVSGIDEKNKFNIPPGLYLFPTLELLDIRDIITASPSELKSIQNTMSLKLDYFISLEQFMLDGYVEYHTEYSDIMDKINKLEERKKKIQESLRKESFLDE